MKKVKMYSLSTCPWCNKAKKYFDEKKVPYEATDYDLASDEKQQSIYKDMHEMGASGFPVVQIGTDVVVGYRPDVYEELLGLKKAG